MCGRAYARRLGALIGALRARAGERGFKAVRAGQTQNLFLIVRRERRLNAAFLRVHQITNPIFAILPGARTIDCKLGELGCRQTIDVRAKEDGFDAFERELAVFGVIISGGA
jgi:hypothetical protein